MYIIHILSNNTVIWYNHIIYYITYYVYDKIINNLIMIYHIIFIVRVITINVFIGDQI